MTRLTAENRQKKPRTADLILDGFRDAIPIMMGYFSVAMAFGLLVRNAGLMLKDSVMFSTIVFAGASQFMALNMIINNTPWISIVAATFLVNFRHFIMSASLSSRLKKTPPWKIPLVAFGVTDETFSVVMAKGGFLESSYVLSVSFFAYISWAGGTASGYLLGSFIPDALGGSLGMGLYVLFMSLLVPEIKRSIRALWIAASAGLLNFGLGYIPGIGSSWALVTAVILSALIFTFIIPDPREEAADE